MKAFPEKHKMQNSAKTLTLILLISIVITKCSTDSKSESKAADTATAAVDSSKSQATASDSLQQTNQTGLKNDSSQQSNVSADWLLTPGVSAGKTVINSNAAGVYKRLGTPDAGDAAMMKSVAIWYSNHDATAHSTAIYTTIDAGNDTAARVKQIRVTSPAFKTKEGIHPSSSLSDIIKMYTTLKKTETYKNAGKTYTVYDSREGIAFEIGPDEKCAAIIVHAPGKDSYGTYLKFR